MSRFLLAGAVLLGCALALAIGRHAQLLAGAADRHH
jgi:hypothetical protein